MSSAVPALKLALLGLLRDLYPDAAVSYGPPQGLSDQMASVGAATVQLERPTAGGSTRSREEVAEIKVILSCASAGDGESFDDAQQAATEAAYAMLDTLEAHFRNRQEAPLGGACRDANVSDHELNEYIATDADDYPTGRIGEITATVTCRTRI